VFAGDITKSAGVEGKVGKKRESLVSLVEELKEKLVGKVQEL
jgi:hypothetical protein